MVKNKIYVLFLLLMIVVIAGCTANGKQDVPEDATKVQDFTFTNQQGQSFGLENLKGKVWMADFIFTNCETVCPPLTANMSKLQGMAKEKGLDVEFVSFSVDPEYDTPEKLLAYGEQFQADFSNWSYLTGYSQKEIEKFAQESFRAIVQKPESTDQVIHTTSYFLVNKDGYVIKSYKGLENTPYEEMLQDIENLQ
jgi:protein SCO1/2